MAVEVCKRDRNLPPSHGLVGVFLHTAHHDVLAPLIPALFSLLLSETQAAGSS
jgi:hypothetical protein